MVTTLKRPISAEPTLEAAGGPPEATRRGVTPRLTGHPRILLIAADQALSHDLRINLEAEGFQVLDARDGEIALLLAGSQQPVAVVLDIMLPGWGGLEVCRRLLADEHTRHIPIVVLSGESSRADGLLAVELGAHDLLMQPFAAADLADRLKRLYRQVNHAELEIPHETYECGYLTVDFDSYRVLISGAEVVFTSGEFKLLSFFVRHPNRVFDRDQLLHLVWGGERSVDPRSVDVQIRRLRRRLEQGTSRGAPLVTVRKVGYMFDERRLLDEA